MSRALAEMMPTVTLPPRPNGLPIAITQSPTFEFSDDPNLTDVRGFLGVTLSRARSVLGSFPITLSTFSREPLLKLMMISSAPSITWVLVTIRPSLPSTTNPEPSDDTLRSCRERPPFLLKKSSKRSSNGEPCGTFGNGAPCGPLTVWLVEMLTTASISFSATGATDFGPLVCAAAEPAATMSATESDARTRLAPGDLAVGCASAVIDQSFQPSTVARPGGKHSRWPVATLRRNHGILQSPSLPVNARVILSTPMTRHPRMSQTTTT